MPTPAASADPRQLLKDLLEIVPDATLVVGGEGRTVHANERLAELLGWPVAELMGRPFEVLIPERFRADHARHFARYLEAPEARPMGRDLDLWACRRDGSELPVEVSLSPWSDGGSTLIVASLRDVSHRHKIEEELRAGEKRFRIAASRTVDFIQEVSVTEDRMDVYGDGDGLMGYEPGEFPRTLTGWLEKIHPEDRGRVQGEMEQAVEAGAREWMFRYRILAADGSYRHWEDHGTVTGYLENGHANEGVGAIRDVTEEVVREQKLRETLAELAAAKERLAAENVYLREEILRQVDVVGESEPWRHVCEQVELVAASDTPVLISGETGTGKELLARALHAASPRAERPLIKVNCAALPSTLIESELFGHEKGAFSGADAARKGRFELADQSTLLLDEIGEMPLELQAKLLHVLQSGELERLGSSKTLRCDVRVIAATNRDLRREVREGRFRSDLYYRLAVFPIEVPPLRDRRDDVALLATYFLTRHSAKHGKAIGGIPPAQLDLLVAYDWPGNVRELENLIERAVILSRGETLALDAVLGEASGVVPAVEVTAARASASESLEDMERAHVVAVLRGCDWKVKGQGNAAERLGLKEGTLRSRMKKLGIRRPGL